MKVKSLQGLRGLDNILNSFEFICRSGSSVKVRCCIGKTSVNPKPQTWQWPENARNSGSLEGFMVVGF